MTTRRALLTGGLAAVGLAVASCAGDSGGPGDGLAGPAADPTLAPTPAPVPLAVGMEHGRRDRPEVALTLHGQGEITLVRALMDVCREAAAPMTVFMVGSWLVEEPTAVRTVLDRGGELANHTWSGEPTRGQTPVQLRGEVVRTRDLLLRTSGGPGSAFRPVQLRRSTPSVLAAASAAGYRHVVTEDVDPADSAGATVAQIVGRVRRLVHPGSVLSLSPTRTTLLALPAVLDLMAELRLQPVAVSRLVRP